VFLYFCALPEYFVQTGGSSSGLCPFESPCQSFEQALASFEEIGAIVLLGPMFSNGNVSISNKTVSFYTFQDNLPVTSNLSYLAGGSAAAFLTLDNSSVMFVNLTIIFDSTNQGPFISVTGYYYYYFSL
jgi:hypothetical protein